MKVIKEIEGVKMSYDENLAAQLKRDHGVDLEEELIIFAKEEKVLQENYLNGN